MSDAVEGTRRPRRFPAVVRPTKRQPAIVAWTTGMWDASSDSKTEKKFSDPPIPVRQYAFVSAANTPTSFEFSKDVRVAIV